MFGETPFPEHQFECSKLRQVCIEFWLVTQSVSLSNWDMCALSPWRILYSVEQKRVLIIRSVCFSTCYVPTWTDNTKPKTNIHSQLTFIDGFYCHGILCGIHKLGTLMNHLSWFYFSAKFVFKLQQGSPKQSYMILNPLKKFHASYIKILTIRFLCTLW